MAPVRSIGKEDVLPPNVEMLKTIVALTCRSSLQ